MAKKKQAELTIEEKLQKALVPKEEQLYKIPNNWCWTYLTKGMAECWDKYRKPINATERNKRLGNIPYYGATGQVGWIDDYLTDEHLVLIGEDGAPFLDLLKNKAYIIKGKSWVNNHAHILKSFYGEIGNKYLCNYLNVFNYKGYINGTTRLKLTQKNLDIIPVPLAPINEQKKIVNRIESLFTKLDKAKELIENTLAQFEQNKMAILHKAFTGELTAKWRKENNIDLSSWKKCELKEVFKVVKDKYNPQTENQIVNYIGLENIETSKGIISKNNSSEVKSIKTKFKKDDVLYGKLRPYLNKHDVVNFDGICSTDILVFRFNDINTAKYINYYFNLPMFIQYAVENSSGINLPRVSEKTISKYKISLPTIEEQQEIVNILDKLLVKYSKIKDLEKQLEQIELLKKAILAKAFRGELGTNNPDEESAKVLLKEILAEK